MDKDSSTLNNRFNPSIDSIDDLKARFFKLFNFTEYEKFLLDPETKCDDRMIAMDECVDIGYWALDRVKELEQKIAELENKNA